MGFVVLGLRAVLRAIERYCFNCRKRKASTLQPMMSDLPVKRLGYNHRPFINCGLDGLFWSILRDNSRSVKRWAFLFSCLTTRAVHIEIVPPMYIGSCVMGIERLFAYRSTPSVVWSDKGTNFYGAQQELLLCVQS